MGGQGVVYSAVSGCDVPVEQQALRNVWVQQEHARVHPCLTVPEGMTVVPLSEPAWGQTERAIGADAAEDGV